MLRLFGRGEEILEAGRQRRSILRFLPFAGPVVGVLRMVGGWDFVVYRYDCDPSPLDAEDIERLPQEVLLQCAAPQSQRVPLALLGQHPTHPAVRLTLGQICDFRCQFEVATQHFDRALEIAPHSQALRQAADQRRKHEYLLNQMLRYPEILIPGNPGLTQSIALRAAVLDQEGKTAEGRSLLLLAARHDPRFAAVVLKMESVQATVDAMLEAFSQASDQK